MPQSQIQCSVSALDHLVLTVRDIPETVRFYTVIFGMQSDQFQAADGTLRWALTFGQQKINLHLVGHEFEPKAHQPTTGSADLCFLSQVPLQHWLAHLAQHSIKIEEGPVRRTGAMGPIISVYLRDPDLNLIEVSVAQH